MDSLKILIVDDTPANIISLSYLLEEYFENLEILTASNGEEALKKVLVEIVDIIILDVQMPVMDGFETAKFLKNNRKTKDIPIIFLTAAFKDDEFIKKGFEVGAVDYLTKPINDNQLINKLKLYIEIFKKNNELLLNQRVLFEQTKLASMGEMIANIAHQWRQPLSVISTAATGMMAQKEYGLLSDEKFIEHCELIEYNAQYLSKIIEDFKQFIESDSEKNKVEFNLSCNMDNFLNLIGAEAKLQNIQININVDENIRLSNYPNELNQVLIKLFKNSLEAFDQNSKRFIFIDVEQTKDKIIISFKDNGGGIDETIKDKIFDPYFTTKHQTQGKGLGLYIVKNFINNMGGQIEVENVKFSYNNQLYYGANFKIILSKK